MTDRYQKLSAALRTDLTNRRFGRLSVLRYSESRHRAAYWLCRCDCGTRKVVIARSLVSGHTKSCGCFCKDMVSKRMKTHGKSKTIEASLWYRARKRAKKLGLEFTLKLDDI